MKSMINWLSVINLLKPSIPFVIISFCGFYLYYTWSYSLNFPFQDDITFLTFIEEVQSKHHSFSSFLYELSKPANDHRVMIPRLVIWVEYLLSGSLNFKIHILIANLNFLIVVAFLYREFCKTGLAIIYFVPIPFIFLQPQMYEMSFWSLTGLQNTFVMVFLIATILLLETKKFSHFIGAIFCAFCGTFSSGNGLFVFVAPCLMLLVQQRFRDSIIWVLSMCSCISLYFFVGYELGQEASPTFSLLKIVLSFWGFIGANMSTFSPTNNRYSIAYGAVISSILLVLILVTLFESFIKKSFGQTQRQIGLLTFVCLAFGTSLAVGIVRSWNGVVIASRFIAYASLSSTILYLILIPMIKEPFRKIVGAISIFCSMLFVAFSYYTFTPLVDNRLYSYRADEYNWLHRRTMLSVTNEFMERAFPLLNKTYQQGIWSVSDYWSQKEVEEALAHPKLDTTASFIQTNTVEEVRSITNEIFRREMVELRNNTVSFVKKSPKDALFVLLVGSNTNKYMIATNTFPAAKKTILRNLNPFGKGFWLSIRKSNFQSGKYQITYIIRRQDRSCEYFLTKETIQI